MVNPLLGQMMAPPGLEVPEAMPMPMAEMEEPEMMEEVEPPRPSSSEVNGWEDVLPAEFMTDGKPDQGKIDNLAKDVYHCIQGAKTARGLILERIQVNESFYRNRPAKAVTLEPYSGAPNYHIPLVAPRLQQRKSSWVDTLTSPDQYFYLNYLGTEEEKQKYEDDLESDLQFLLEAANFEGAIGDLGDTMMPCNMGILWTTFAEHHIGAEYSSVMGPYAGFKFEVIHPNYFLCFPANYPSILKQRLVGHEFEMRVAEAESKIRNGIWMDEKVVGGNGTLRMERIDPGLAEESTTGKIEDQNVKLGDFLVKYAVEDGEDEKYYRVIADTDNLAVYRIEPYDDAYPWYTPFRIYKDLNAFWSEDSPANDGQSSNMMLNALINNALWGIQYASRSTVLGKSMPGQDSMMNMPPGAFVPVSTLGETQALSSNFSLTGIDFLVNFVMRLADMAMKVPDTIAGGSAKDETATAQQIKFQGFQLMGGADIKATNSAMVQVAQLCLQIMYDNWTSIHNTYGKLGVIKTQDRELLKRPMIVSVAGQKPKAAPQIQQQELSSALQLIGQNPILAQNVQLMLEMTEKFVNQTSIEGKEDIVKAISKSSMDMAQWMEIVTALQAQGMTPEMLVQLVQSVGGGGQDVPPPPGANVPPQGVAA